MFSLDEIEKLPVLLFTSADYKIRDERCEIPGALSEGEFCAFECEKNSSGLIHIDYIAPKGARIILAFDETLSNGKFLNKMQAVNVIDVEGEGNISFENFEIYGFKYYAIFVISGEIELKNIYKRLFKNLV